MSLRRTPVAAICGLAAVTLLAGCTNGSTNGSTNASSTTLPVASASAPSSVPPSVAPTLAPASAAATPAATARGNLAAEAIAKPITGYGAPKPAAPPAAAPPAAAPAAAAAALPAPGKVGASRRLAGLTIVLDPGHNGGNEAAPARLNAPVPAGGFTKPCNTVGAETNAGYPEHAFNWDVVTRAAAMLRAQGATVVLTRDNDTGFGPCVNERAAIANAAHADAMVAVHADGAASGAYGYHVIAPALAPDHNNRAILAESWSLAQDVHTAFHQATDEPNATYVSGGLTRRSDLAGLNLSQVPAIFIECANMRNPTDASHLTDPAWRQQAAAGIVAGIAAFLHR